MKRKWTKRADMNRINRKWTTITKQLMNKNTKLGHYVHSLVVLFMFHPFCSFSVPSVHLHVAMSVHVLLIVFMFCSVGSCSFCWLRSCFVHSVNFCEWTEHEQNTQKMRIRYTPLTSNEQNEQRMNNINKNTNDNKLVHSLLVLFIFCSLISFSVLSLHCHFVYFHNVHVLSILCMFCSFCSFSVHSSSFSRKELLKWQWTEGTENEHNEQVMNRMNKFVHSDHSCFC